MNLINKKCLCFSIKFHYLWYFLFDHIWWWFLIFLIRLDYFFQSPNQFTVKRIKIVMLNCIASFRFLFMLIRVVQTVINRLRRIISKCRSNRLQNSHILSLWHIQKKINPCNRGSCVFLVLSVLHIYVLVFSSPLNIPFIYSISMVTYSSMCDCIIHNIRQSQSTKKMP